MKLPAFQFYTGDWLKDPKLSLCTPATRGIWIDLISAMHELDRSGVLRGTAEQLARLARCSTVELVQALTELQVTEAANVTERNGIFTAINRRMKREADSRKSARIRQSRHRGKDDGTREVTPLSRDNHPPSSSSPSGEVKERGREVQAAPPSAKAEFWEVLCSIFGTKPTSHQEELRLYEQCGEFRTKGATVDEIRARVARYRELWPDMPCTIKAVLRNWDVLTPKTKPVRKAYYMAEQPPRASA